MKRRIDNRTKVLRSILRILILGYIIFLLFLLNAIVNNNHSKEAKNEKTKLDGALQCKSLLHQGVKTERGNAENLTDETLSKEKLLRECYQ